MTIHYASKVPWFTSQRLALLSALLLASCGGGGSSTNPPAGQAAANSSIVDLADPQVALKVSSALIGSSALGANFTNSAWTAKDFQGASRTETSGCSKTTLTNPDGIVSAGDVIAFEGSNCVSSFAGGTLTEAFTGTSTLSSISNSETPELGVWTVRNVSTVSLNSKWTIAVTSNNYNFDGAATSTADQTLDISHAADGSQIETIRVKVSAKGSENGAAFDYVIEGDLVCSYAAGSKAETCSNTRLNMTGQIAGKTVNAVLTQNQPNVTNATSTYEVVQGNQKVTVAFSFQDGFAITTASGAVLSARYNNFALLSGY
jgi:hypothetical protein